MESTKHSGAGHVGHATPLVYGLTYIFLMVMMGLTKARRDQLFNGMGAQFFNGVSKNSLDRCIGKSNITGSIGN